MLARRIRDIVDGLAGRSHAPPQALAPDVPPKPPDGGWRGPSSWMLAPEVLAGVSRYAFYKDDLDQRDWMEGTVADHRSGPRADELWFDYIADIGDTQRSMYGLAYVCQDDVWVDGDIAPETIEANGAYPPLRVPSGPSAAPPGAVLRRGELLFVGGDGACPIADAPTLRTNVQHPFTWAYRDLVAAGRRSSGGDGRERATRLYGIPGNHDYYDELTGFSLLIRNPIEGETLPAEQRPSRAPLRLLGFERTQRSSYLAIELPWGWELWGLDFNRGRLDPRQAQFFRRRPRPERLILATSQPSVVDGAVVGPGSASAQAHGALGRFLGIPETREVWVRCCGMLLLGYAVYYVCVLWTRMVEFLPFTVLVRGAVIFFFTTFVLLGWAKPIFILFGVIDGAGAVWTAIALYVERKRRLV
jgi:hypothetical protein